ncbi:MAG: dihydrofolate reductase [Caulobacteraceae bacterium]|nr:dihydrofolate reductase [Caulobacteraceae bacterium]
MPLPDIALVVARARNGVIGRDGRLPWRLRSDLQWFKANTIGKPCIMGRATWDSLPLRPLPGRLNVVLSRDPEFRPKGALVCVGLDEAIEIARETAIEDGVSEVAVIGGARLFEQVLPRATRIYLTEVEAEPEGDTLMPPFDETAFQEVRRESHPAGEKDDHPFTFRVLERRRKL